LSYNARNVVVSGPMGPSHLFSNYAKYTANSAASDSLQWRFEHLGCSLESKHYSVKSLIDDFCLNLVPASEQHVMDYVQGKGEDYYEAHIFDDSYSVMPANAFMTTGWEVVSMPGPNCGKFAIMTRLAPDAAVSPNQVFKLLDVLDSPN